MRRTTVALVAIVAVSALLRLLRLGGDIPLEAEPTNSPALDAFWYLEAAAARADGVRLEACAPYDLAPWVALARAWFWVFGAGHAQACALGAAVGVASVLAVFALVRPLGARTALGAAAWLAVAYPFVQNGRTALVYGPVALAMIVVGALYVRGTRASTALAWCLGLALPVVLKPQAGALAGGLALAQVLRATPGKRARGVAVVAAIALAAGGTIVAFDPLAAFSLNRMRLENYSAPWEWRTLIERTLGLAAPIAWLSPALLALAAIGLGLAWRDLGRLEGRARDALAIAVGWGLTFALAAIPMSYQPVRYYIPAFPAAAVLAGYALSRLSGESVPEPSTPRPLLALVVAAPAGAIAGAHAFEVAAHLAGRAPLPLPWLAAGAFAGSVALVLAVVLRVAPSPRLARLAAVGLVTLGTLDLARDVKALAPVWTVVRARRTAREALDPSAVLAGPYASVLAIGTPLERRRARIPELDSAAPGDAIAEAMKARGYTHFALDFEQDWRSRLAERLTAAGLRPRLVAVLYLRCEPVHLYRFSWAEELGYRPSPFERARAIEEDRGSEAAEAVYASAGADRDPDLLLGRVRALVHTGHVTEAPRVVWAARERFPDDAGIAQLALDLDRLLVGMAPVDSGSRK